MPTSVILRCFLSFIVVMIFHVRALADPFGYILDFDGNLKEVDLDGPTVINHGPTGMGSASLRSLAIDNNNTLYTLNDFTGSLYTLAANGAPTLIGDTGLEHIGGFDFDPTFTYMVAMVQTGPTQFKFYKIFPDATASLIVTSTASLSPDTQSLAVQDSTTAYTLTPSASGGELSRVNLSTGVITHVSYIPGPLGGMDFASDGYLYGIGSNQAFRIDPVTGASELLAGAHGDALALAIPVPEPASVSVLVAALAVFSRRQRALDCPRGS